MTALDLRPVRRAAPSPTAWAGAALSGIVGAFLAADGFARLSIGRSLVAGAAPIEGVEALVGGSLILGAALLATRRGRLLGAGLLALLLCGLAVAEGRAANPSPDHLLFWLYVAALVAAASLLRRSNPKT